MLKRILKITAIFSSVVIMAGILAYYTIHLVVKQENTVVVPDLMGKKAVEAMEILAGKSLNIKLKDTIYSATVPEGLVMDQDPRAGTTIKEGRDVKIVISKGPESFEMPALVGKASEEAVNLIQALGLTVNELSYTNEGVKNQVIAQFPLQDATIFKGSAVDLLVSSGAPIPLYATPHLVGMSLWDAVSAIEKNRLILGRVTRLHDVSKPSDIVLDQAPDPGNPVQEKTAIHITVNKPSGLSNDADDITGVNLFRYQLPFGYLKRRIRVVLNAYGISNNIYEDFVQPGEDLWFFIPKNETASILVFEGDDLLIKQNYGM